MNFLQILRPFSDHFEISFMSCIYTRMCFVGATVAVANPSFDLVPASEQSHRTDQYDPPRLGKSNRFSPSPKILSPTPPKFQNRESLAYILYLYLPPRQTKLSSFLSETVPFVVFVFCICVCSCAWVVSARFFSLDSLRYASFMWVRCWMVMLADACVCL